MTHPDDDAATGAPSRCREYLCWLLVIEEAVEEVTRRFDFPAELAEAAAHNAAASIAVLDDTARLDLALFLQARENAVTARAGHTAAAKRGDIVEAESRRLVAEHFEALAARKRRQLPAVVLFGRKQTCQVY